MNGKMGVKSCLHHWPTRVLCVAMSLLQAVSMNWYLMSGRSYVWASIYGADTVVLVLFLVTFLVSSRNINTEKHANNISFTELKHLSLAYTTWLVYIVVFDVKVVVIYSTVVKDLKETDFFGPNTLKATLALTAIVFLAFVPTLSDIQHGPRKDLINGLTSTVTVDILDGVDFLEFLYDDGISDTFPRGLDAAIITASCIDFLLPIVPLFVLARKKFGLKTLSGKSIATFKLVIVYAVNCPLFVIRLYIWHGLSHGISIFLLKNMIAMGVVTFELFEKYISRRTDSKQTETNLDNIEDEYIPNIMTV